MNAKVFQMIDKSLLYLSHVVQDTGHALQRAIDYTGDSALYNLVWESS